MFVQPSTSRFPSKPLTSLAGLAEVRRSFVEWLQGFGVAADQIDELSVVISELGANAVRESHPNSEPPTVEASTEGTTLHLRVENGVGPETTAAHEHDWDFDDALRTGGRGLLLVSAFVDDVLVEVVDQRLSVRCTATLRGDDD